MEQMNTAAHVPYAIACAYFGGHDPQHSAGVLALEFGEPRVRVFRTNGVPYIDQARAILAAAAIERVTEDDAILVFLDHDIVFHPSELVDLVNVCAASDFDVVGVPYSMRSEASGIIGFPELPTDGSELELKCYESGGLYPAFGMGMGFTAIKMRVFRELAKTMQRVRCGTKTVVWPFFALDVQPNHSTLPSGEQIGFYHGEDVSFCRRAIAAGFRCALYTRPRIGHKGTKIYALEDCIYQVPWGRNLTMRLIAPESPADYNFQARSAPARGETDDGNQER